MAALAPDFVHSVEGHRARSGHVELPACDGLRQAAAATAVMQYLMTTRFSGVVDLTPGVQAGFALTGFLLVAFLLEDRGKAGLSRAGDSASTVRATLRSLPISQIAVLVAAILYLPRLLAVESVEVPDLREVPALIDRALRSGLAEFHRGSFEGPSLIAWPLVVLLVPRRLLSLALLGALGAGLTVQFSGLLSGEARPVSILVAPSPLDLLAAGALAAAIFRGAGRPGGGPLARWALLMGLAIGAASVGCWHEAGASSWGSSALLSAPPGFGAANFILKIMATTLVGSLAWRDVGA